MFPRTIPDSRDAAKLLGVNRYFTGTSCINGHTDLRVTVNGHCLSCDKARQKIRLTTDQDYIAKNKVRQRNRMRIVLSDPVKRAKINADAAARYAASDDIRAKQKAYDKGRNSTEKAKARRRELQKIRYHTKLKFDAKHIMDRRERGEKWAKDNSDRANARTAYRRSLRIKASPKWLTEADMNAIQCFYNLALIEFRRTGVRHEVDHIVPLNHPDVCGLHVPWNLQVITEKENRAKGNKFTGLNDGT